MMFGRRPTPQRNWGEMYLYEKVQHVADHSIDFVVSKCRWWLPSVAAGVLVSFVLLGGPEGLPQVFSLATTAASPVVSPVMFQLPKGVPEGPGEDEDESD